MLHFLRPQVVSPGPGPLFLTGWGVLGAFILLSAIGIGGWYFLLRRNRERIESERLAEQIRLGRRRSR